MSSAENHRFSEGRVRRSRLGSIRSLSRQKRLRSLEELNFKESHLFASPAGSSAQSIPDLSHASTANSSPVGDFVETAENPSVLQKAAWFLAHRSEMEAATEKPKGLLSVGRSIQRTGSQLRKTRLYHIFYVLVVPIYTILGAFLFQWLDGEHDDTLLSQYEKRCDSNRIEQLTILKQLCKLDGEECFTRMKSYMESIELCYRRWHAENRTVTHSMNDFTNALVYAFSVYTTIGYGNMAADTIQCRLATIAYGAFGIPLFFAFVKEAGNLFRNMFIATYNRLSRLQNKYCRCSGKREMSELKSSVSEPKDCAIIKGAGSGHRPVILISETDTSKKAQFARKCSTNSVFGASGKRLVDEQRRVFFAGVLVFVLYILLVSLLFSLTTEFDYFTSVYFLFNSVALIGFGDIFPTNPKIIILYAVFIVLGVVLFSMCYFILQEEIRNQAFEASRRARISLSKYSHTIMQHASRSAWSRRNSPLLESSPETAFERMRKRRQSAPAVTLAVPPR